MDLDIRMDMPTDEDRYLIIKDHLKSLSLNGIGDEDLRGISKAASGFVSSDLGQIVRNAHLMML